MSFVKPCLQRKVENRQAASKRQQDGDSPRMRSFDLNQSVRVRNVRGGKEKWIPGVIVDIKGPSTYLVRVPGNSRRFVHADHLIPDETVVRQDDQFQRSQSEYGKAPVLPEPKSVEQEPRDIVIPSSVVPTSIEPSSVSPSTPKKIAKPAIVSESLNPSSPAVPLRRSSRVVKPPVKLYL